MADITLRLDGDVLLRHVQKTLDALDTGQCNRVLARAINRVLPAVRAEAGRIAKERYTAKPKKLFDAIKIVQARRDKPMGTIHLGGKPGVSLIHFKARPNKPGRRPRAGVSAQILKGGPRKIKSKKGFDKPFVMRKSQGGQGVFLRRHGGKDLVMQYGPSPSQAIARRAAEERIQDRAQEIYIRRVEHEIEALIAGITK